jgi:hypothetical protein
MSTRIKKLLLGALGLSVLVLWFLYSAKVGWPGTPIDIPVLVCQETSRFYAPGCAEVCGEENQLRTLTISKAFEYGYWPSERCTAEGWFDEREVRLLFEVFDYLGVIHIHPWNRDGTWREDFFGRKEYKDELAVSQEWQGPGLSDEELIAIYLVAAKALNQPLAEEDLLAVKESMHLYASRAGRGFAREQAEWFAMKYGLGYQYDYELVRCILISMNRKEPFVSPKLRRLRGKMEEVELSIEQEIDADMRKVRSAAYGSEWIDEFGQRQLPLDREYVVAVLGQLERAKPNFEKLAQLFRDLSDQG